MKIVVFVLTAALVIGGGCSGTSDDKGDKDSGIQADLVSGEVAVDTTVGSDLQVQETVDMALPDDLSVPEEQTTQQEILDIQGTELPEEIQDGELVLDCPPGEGCDDDDACTENDTCNDEGVCTGQTVVCDDGDPCTMGWCVPDTGCKYEDVVAAPCDDGDPCTVGDLCSDGECMGGLEGPDCSDDNLCTDDICVPFEGCDNVNNEADCDDGEICTTGDACKDGVCQAGELTCGCQDDLDCEQYEDGNMCNGLLYCNETLFPPACVVDPATVVNCSTYAPVACNKWSCDPPSGDCITMPLANGTLCDDGNQCTISDNCLVGKCTGTQLPHCGVGKPCQGPGDCNTGLTCFTGMPGGYCTKLNCQEFGCPPGTVCNSINDGQMTICQKECDEAGDCRVDEGHGCTEAGGCWCGEEWCTAGEGSCLGEIAGVCNTCGSALEPGAVDCTLQDLVCKAGECVPCEPDCTDKECGADGCDGSCGTCGQYKICDNSGKCVCDCPAVLDPYCDTTTGITYPNQCQALCAGVAAPEQGACPNCQDFCTADDLMFQELCGKDGVTYSNFCQLKCSIGGPDCTVVETCHDLAHTGACLDACWVSDPTAVEEGAALTPFACKDLNDSSSWFGQMLTEVTMKELVWIAYLGSCT